MVAADGAGWAVTGGNDELLPGRWADEATAREQGLLGVYLLSGVDVVNVCKNHNRRTCWSCLQNRPGK